MCLYFLIVFHIEKLCSYANIFAEKVHLSSKPIGELADQDLQIALRSFRFLSYSNRDCSYANYAENERFEHAIDCLSLGPNPTGIRSPIL